MRMGEYLRRLLRMLGPLLGCVIGLVLVTFVLDGGCLDKRYPTFEEREEALAALVSPYDAVRDWDKAFRAGEVMLPEGRWRAAHTEDIKKALVRTDSRPVLIIGRIWDRYSGTQAGGKHFIRVEAYYHQAPILDLWLSCSKEVYKKTSGPLDKGWHFAGIVQANTVMRPISEDETYTFEPGMPAIELDSDTYFVTGECLDILYIR